MKTKKTLYSALSLLLVAVLAVTLFMTKGPRNSSIGSFTLRVNPEIRVSYNQKGNVTEITAKNEDGQKILDACKSFKGVPCEQAVAVLLNSIYENGYFNNMIDGNQRNIVLILDPNSAVPSEDFLTSLRNGAQATGEALHISSSVVEINPDDFTMQAPKNEQTPANCLTVEKAKNIALAQAGVEPSKATFRECELERENGILVYDLEFVVGDIKYDYDIDAVTGKVLKAEHKSISAKNPSTKPGEAKLSLEDAKAIALKYAGVSASNAKFDEKECEFDKHEGKYEIEFTDGKFVYEYDIDAVTGAIISSQQEDVAYVAAKKAEEAREDEEEALEDAEEAKKEALEEAEEAKKEALEKAEKAKKQAWEKANDPDDDDDDDINEIDDDDDDEDDD